MRGPALMRGYSDVPRSETFDDDGWFATGDLGRVEEVDASSGETGARVWLYAPPKKDIIKTGGENVSPEEVERVVNSHEHVAALCRFRCVSSKVGEIVCACIELANAVEDEDAAGRPFARTASTLASRDSKYPSISCSFRDFRITRDG